MEILFKQEDAPVLSAEHLERMGKVTQRAVQTRMEVETLHEDAERREREREKEAQQAARPQRSEQERMIEVARRVDQILGVTRPKVDADGAPPT
jgi:hypothetical protein